MQVFCSGKKCTEVWGQVGAGDRIVKLDDGEVVKGYEGVGPGQQQAGDDWQEQMDRHIDPRSGDELPYCVGPQCEHEQKQVRTSLRTPVHMHSVSLHGQISCCKLV